MNLERTRSIRRRLLPTDFKEFYVQRELDRLGNGVYLEIGVRRGESFRPVRARTKIGVDPVRSPEMTTLLPGEFFFAMTSDAFFADEAPRAIGEARVDVALIDGLHRYDQVVADVANAAQWMNRDGVIVLDDCNPRTAARAVESPTGDAWNGDVWRAMALLRRTQPQWNVATIDADQGVGMIWGFGQPLATISEVERETCRTLSYADLDSDRRLIGLIRAPHSSRLLGRINARARAYAG